MRYLTASLLNINEAAMTIRLLEQLTALSAQGWAIQLILVDNGSEANQLRQLADWFSAHKTGFAELLWLVASHNLGATGGRNVAFKLAAHDKILILDNDVILPDDAWWLNRLWQHLEEHPHLGIVGPTLVFADQPDIIQAAGAGFTSTGRVGYLRRAELVESIPPVLIEVMASPSACWLIRRQAQQSVGLLAEEFYPVQYEDIDFCVRLTLAGWKIACDGKVKIKHIEHVTTRSLKEHPFARLTVRQAMKFRDKWLDALPQLATLSEDEIYWGPIPRTDVKLLERYSTD